MFKKLFNINLLVIRCLFANILLFAVFSCTSDPEANVKIPGNILSEEVFTNVLTDFALAESAANLNIKEVPVLRMDTVYAFDPLVENNVTQAKYDSTIAFYAGHPELYKKIYETVLANLSEIQTKREANKADSVKK